VNRKQKTVHGQESPNINFRTHTQTNSFPLSYEGFIKFLVVVYLGHDESAWYLNLKALQQRQVQRDHLHYFPSHDLDIQE